MDPYYDRNESKNVTVSKLKKGLGSGGAFSLLLRDLRPTFAADQITSRISGRKN